MTARLIFSYKKLTHSSWCTSTVTFATSTLFIITSKDAIMPQNPTFRNIRAVIFDFDATIADTASDIIESKLYAMRQLGQPEPDRDLVRALLGMNTRDSFYIFSDMSNEVMVDEAVELFHRQALRMSGLGAGAPSPFFRRGKRDTRRAAAPTHKDRTYRKPARRRSESYYRIMGPV